MLAEKYKLGKKTTDIALEILNLNKTEILSIDSISNQDFTEVGSWYICFFSPHRVCSAIVSVGLKSLLDTL